MCKSWSRAISAVAFCRWKEKLTRSHANTVGSDAYGRPVKVLLRVMMDFTYLLNPSLHVTDLLMAGSCNHIFRVSGAFNVGQAEVVHLFLQTTP